MTLKVDHETKRTISISGLELADVQDPEEPRVAVLDMVEVTIHDNWEAKPEDGDPHEWKELSVIWIGRRCKKDGTMDGRARRGTHVRIRRADSLRDALNVLNAIPDDEHRPSFWGEIVERLQGELKDQEERDEERKRRLMDKIRQTSES